MTQCPFTQLRVTIFKEIYYGTLNFQTRPKCVWPTGWRLKQTGCSSMQHLFLSVRFYLTYVISLPIPKQLHNERRAAMCLRGDIFCRINPNADVSVDFLIREQRENPESAVKLTGTVFWNLSKSGRGARATSQQMAGASRGSDLNRGRQAWHWIALTVCSTVGCTQHFKVHCLGANTLPAHRDTHTDTWMYVSCDDTGAAKYSNGTEEERWVNSPLSV